MIKSLGWREFEKEKKIFIVKGRLDCVKCNLFDIKNNCICI